MNEADLNYTKEAFLHPWNLTFLIAAMLTAFSVSMTGGAVAEWGFNTVMLFSAAVELLYLGVMPKQPRFQRAVKARQAAELNKPKSQKDLYYELNAPNQRRYTAMRKLEKGIRENYLKLSYTSQGLLESHLKKIDGLLDSYLNLLHQQERLRVALRNSTEQEVVRTIAELRQEMTSDPPKVRAIKERRLRILEQRLERSKKGLENMEIIDAQLETIEDVTKYIHEQSLTLRNPEEITFQLDTLLSEVEETQAAIEEIEDVFSPASDLLGGIDTYEDPGTTPSQPTSTRQKN
jgi:hypothetical protein